MTNNDKDIIYNKSKLDNNIDKYKEENDHNIKFWYKEDRFNKFKTLISDKEQDRFDIESIFIESFNLFEDNYYIINEAYNPNYKRKYQCPYCESKLDKMKLINHIEEYHIDLLPKDFTPARKVFNIINKKEYGTCVESGKRTKWNEEKMRYERFYSKKEALQYRERFKKRMIDTHGKIHLLDDPETQKLLLSHRKISGEYKFKDGGIHTYVGSHEKERLEFMDKVLNIPSTDLITPGPVIEYIYKGESHFWITDAYYIPYNLVIDDKDGGKNPNTHQGMAENKLKQIAKEKAITKLNKYNYIRLTNKEFDQLMYVMMKIKNTLREDSNMENKIIQINESTNISDYINIDKDIHSKLTNDKLYFITFSKNEYGIENIAVSNNILLDCIFVVNPETHKLEIQVSNYLEEYSNIQIFQYKSNSNYIKSVIDDYIIKPFIENKDILDMTYIFNIFLNKKINTPYDILLNEETEFLYNISDISKYNPLKEIQYDKKLGIKIIEESNIIKKSKKLRNKPTIEIYENQDGYFVQSLISNRSSKYFESIDDIKPYIIELIERGY